MNRKKIIIGVLVLVVAAAMIGANVYFKRDPGVAVQVEKIQKRDLEAIVSASGKIRAKRSVNISANTMGRVTKRAVGEGPAGRRASSCWKSIRDRSEPRGSAAMPASASSASPSIRPK